MKIKIIKAAIVVLFLGLLFFIYDTYRYKFYNYENKISVLTYNCGNDGKQANLEQIAEILEYADKPDIVFLQDIPWPVKVPAICKFLNYPYYATARNLPRPFANLAIISKYPLSGEEKLFFDPVRKTGLLGAIATVNKAEIFLCCVKLSSLSKDIVDKGNSISPAKVVNVMYKELFCNTEHKKNADAIIDYSKNKKLKPVIIGGDFNTISIAKSIRLINQSYKDSFRFSPRQFVGTRIKYLIKPRIDYIFTSGSFKSIRNRIIKKTYGDHYPVYAELLIKYGGL